MMRFLFLLLIVLCSCKRPVVSTSSQYTECENFILDYTDGTMNGVKPNLSQNEIKEWIPCFEKLTPNGAEADCGGGIFYNKYNFSYYTYIDNCLEVYKGFKGKGDSLFLMNREAYRSQFGTPAQTTLSESNLDKDFFTTEYGCIRVHYKEELPVLIGFHYADCESINWCVK